MLSLAPWAYCGRFYLLHLNHGFRDCYLIARSGSMARTIFCYPLAYFTFLDVIFIARLCLDVVVVEKEMVWSNDTLMSLGLI